MNLIGGWGSISVDLCCKNIPCGSRGIIIHYNYRDGPRLGQDIVSVYIITCSCELFQIKLSLSWDLKKNTQQSRLYILQLSVASTQTFWLFIVILSL